MAAPAALAATIPVTTTFDELNADGDCSLREAIQAANTDTPVDACPAGTGPDVIQLAADFYTLSIPGTDEDGNATGDLDLTSNLTILGANSTIVAGGIDRVLDVPTPGVTVTLSSLIVRGGAGNCFGGGIATANATTVTIASSHFLENRAGNGGAISNLGTLTLDGSVVRDNEGGHRGGGIFNAGFMVVNHSVLFANHMTSAGGCPGSAFFGGGAAFNEPGGLLTLENTALMNNSSAHVGGGIYNWFDATVNVSRSTFSGNIANDRGGGFGNLGRFTVANSTISGNRAIQDGGALTQLADTVTLTNTTVSDNTSQNGVGGIQFQGGSPPNLGSSILANSTGGDCSGALNSLGYNLIEDPSGCMILGDPTGNILGVDPMLAPLASNGGPTLTHELLAGSPAIDAASPACPPPATDQRGVLRPQGARCDIGSFEREGAVRVAQHFQSYDLNQPERVGETVTLIDQFGSRTVRLEEVEWLMNPVEKRRTGLDPVPIERADEHLTCYGLPVVSVAERTVHVRNQFTGDSTLRIGRPLTLCTPAAKTLAGTAGAPPTDLDHFQCYDVRGESPRFRSETLTLRDQFGTRTVRIDRTRELCNPVEKRRTGHDPEPIKRPDEHLVCYRIETHTPSFSALTVFTNDQFGLDTLRVVSPRRLCVPSEKGSGPLTG